MTLFQQIPIFFDVSRFFAYGVKQPPLPYVQIATAGGSSEGSVTLKPQNYFLAFGLTVVTNYDNVAPVVRTANSNATLGRPFVPNNFTLKINRGNNNKYSNSPIPQALICSNGYRAGKMWPTPIVYGPRTNIQFTFQDITGLFLLTATSGGEAVPLKIQMFIEGYDIPIEQWDKFCRIFPEFSNVFGAPPAL